MLVHASGGSGGSGYLERCVAVKLVFVAAHRIDLDPIGARCDCWRGKCPHRLTSGVRVYGRWPCGEKA